MNTSIATSKAIHTVELSVTDAPEVKADFVYYTITRIRMVFEDDQLTELTMTGVEPEHGETEEIGTDLDKYEYAAPWIRREVEKHRPSRMQSAYRATVLHEAANIAGEPIPEGAPTEDWEDLIAAVEAIREKAEEAERAADPGWSPKDFLGFYFDIGSESSDSIPTKASAAS